MKKNTGITLVALVITIIILLILAGVAISMITGGEGLFAKANDVATKYNQAARNEADLLVELLNSNYLNTADNGKGEDKSKNTEPIKSIAHVGDFVNYSVTVDGIKYDKWRVLNLDNEGFVEIVCYNGPDFTLGENDNTEKTVSDYNNAIKLLYEAAVTFGTGQYAHGARHFGYGSPLSDEYEVVDIEYPSYSYLSPEIYATPNSDRKQIEGIDEFFVSEFWESYLWREAGRLGSGTWSEYYVGDSSLLGCYEMGEYYVKSRTCSIAPVVFLNEDVMISTGIGDGSMENPWILTN